MFLIMESPLIEVPLYSFFERNVVFFCLRFQDVIISVLLAVGYFCGAIPLAVHAGDWRFWKSRGTESDIETYNINGIISSAEATAVSVKWQLFISHCVPHKLRDTFTENLL